MDEDESYPLDVIVGKIRDYLEGSGLIEDGEFEIIKDDLTELARGIVSEVESSYGM
jgi:hypothetical protein